MPGSSGRAIQADGSFGRLTIRIKQFHYEKTDICNDAYAGSPGRSQRIDERYLGEWYYDP